MRNELRISLFTSEAGRKDEMDEMDEIWMHNWIKYTKIVNKY